jgi:hypothetical protein
MAELAELFSQLELAGLVSLVRKPEPSELSDVAHVTSKQGGCVSLYCAVTVTGSISIFTNL